jgi:hypothetical protein
VVEDELDNMVLVLSPGLDLIPEESKGFSDVLKGKLLRSAAHL